MACPKYAHYELRVLEYLETADRGRASQWSIQRWLGIHKSSLTDVIERLVQEGLVTRCELLKVEGGRPIHTRLLTITSKGRDHYEKIPRRYKELNIPPTVSKYLEGRKPQVRNFFPIQQRFLRRGLLFSKRNISVFGYPASGKTLVAEMLMAKVISEGGRSVYLTPYKALDWQKYQDFRVSFSGIGARVAVNDGDSRVTEEDLRKAQIIVATYERAYGALRSNEEWISNVTLLCADEITLLADEERGGTIDLLLTEVKNRMHKTRILTLSSLVGNPRQICQWLGSEAVIENMPPSGIAVSEQLVFQSGDGVDFLSRDGEQAHVQTSLDPISYLVRRNLEKGMSTLVFVGPRFLASRLAEKLKEFHRVDPDLEESARAFLAKQEGPTILTKKAIRLIPYSTAFHHAGLLRETRRFVEELLRTERLMTVTATTTLSHGVDYAIDSVVIDSAGLAGVRKRDLEGYEYINMKGRAGRPGKSNSASIYIVTENDKANAMFNRYFARGTEPLCNTKAISKDRIAELVVTGAIAGQTLDEVNATIESTLTRQYSRSLAYLVKQVFGELRRMGIVQVNGDLLVPTETGITLNNLNLSPYELPAIMKLSPSSTDERILDVASNTGLAKNLRRRGLLRLEDPTIGVLMSWLEETDLDEIQIFNPSGYYDQDIVELAKETANSLVTMTQLLPQMGPRLQSLGSRVRFGIREDLAGSDLLKIPYFRQRPARELLRKLFNSRLTSIDAIRSSDPDVLCERLQVSREVANELIFSSKQAVA